MTFKNGAQLKRFLMEKCANAVSNAERKVHAEFAGNLHQFYMEFSPKEYIRTGALFNALEVTGVKQSGNSVTTEIYFDTPHYDHGWVPLQSGGFGYSCWDDGYILDVAMKGSHGGYEDGTAIWDESIMSLGGNNGIKNLLIQELKKQGL